MRLLGMTIPSWFYCTGSICFLVGTLIKEFVK